MIDYIIAVMLHLVALEPKNPVNTDPEYRQTLAETFVAAGGNYELDPFLLVTWSFEESSFKSSAKGDLEEKGLFQVHGIAERTCNKRGFDMSVVQEQIMCGAWTIAVSKRDCGNLRSGLWRYASGKCKGTPRAKRITERRLNRVARLKRRAGWVSESK